MPVRSAGIRQPSYHKVVVAVSVGNLIEVYDIIVYGYFATILAREFFPPGDPTAALLATFAIFAVGFFVRPIGAIIFGHVGDRFGRRIALAFSLWLMMAATAAFGLLPSYARAGLLAPLLLLVCRLLQGLSASAELPGAMLFILEHAPNSRRGLAVSINNAAGGLAAAAAAGVSLTLANLLTADQLATWGWRMAFLVAVPIGLVGLYMRTRLLDSPDFVALGEYARQGRAPLTRALGTVKRGMLVLTIWFGAQTIGSYLLSGLMPTYLIREVGLAPAEAYTANLVAILASTVIAMLGGYLADRLPLRPVAIVVMAGVALTAVPGFLIITSYRTMAAAIVGQIVSAIFLGAAYIVGALWAMRLFPTGIRFTAFAVPLGIGTTIFGSTAPYVSTWLIATTHNPVSPAYYVLAATAVATVAAILGLPSRDKSPQ